VSPIPPRVRDAINHLPAGERDQLGTYLKENSPTARVVRSPAFQRDARVLLARLNWKPAAGQTHGAALLDVLKALNDPARERAVKAALGLSRNATRPQMLAGVLEVVPGLAHTPSELDRLLGQVDANDVQDQLWLRRLQSDLDQKPDRVPPPRADAVERERDASERRQLIANLYDASAARRPRRGEYVHSDLRLDVARHYDAHHGEMFYADPSSPGVKQWMNGITEAEWVTEGNRMANIREEARGAREAADAFEDSLSPDADMADARAELDQWREGDNQ
jgi:hypothetical protein